MSLVKKNVEKVDHDLAVSLLNLPPCPCHWCRGARLAKHKNKEELK
jgi:hypothetical protein